MKGLAWLVVVLWLAAPAAARPLHLAYPEAGLTERQAAAHLLSRFTYGARPLEVEAVLAQGLEVWLAHQLAADLPEDDLERRLHPYTFWGLSNASLRQQYRSYGQMANQAEAEGLAKLKPEAGDAERKAYNEALNRWATEHDLRFIRQLFEDVQASRLLRATYANNQLREVMTDFWFNHFNVAALPENVRFQLVSYERDILRPHCLGRFEDLLLGTAKHPAMLIYLNNNQSSAPASANTTLQARLGQLPPERAAVLRKGQPVNRKNGGLNENYARELMELHTLGVDGGYSQDDVVEAARVLSGWTLYPLDPKQDKLRAVVDVGPVLGYVRQGEFLFRADWHDAGAKRVLGRAFPAGAGLSEGENLLHMLAARPATAHHLAQKLATHFVSDEPPQAVVERLEETYIRSGGDLKAMLETLVECPEFWQSRGQKVKSPFELMVSSLRALEGEVATGRAPFDWLNRMGQPLYMCPVPTGFKDTADGWLNSATMMARMNFGMALAQGRIPGLSYRPGRVKDDPSGLECLDRAARRVLPEPLEGARLARLEATLSEGSDGYKTSKERPWFSRPRPLDFEQRRKQARWERAIGVILGSPDFQRR